MSTSTIVSLRPQWQQELAQAITDPLELVSVLNISDSLQQQDIAARGLFPLRVPRHFVSLMEAGNRFDPLLLQVLPQADEFNEHPDFVTDPLVEQSSQGALLHKYQSRVLVIFRGGCAINCRYCFRRHFPYQEHHFGRAERTQLLSYIQAHADINEVILSGGDPLLATDDQISRLLTELERLPQLKRVRIHSRLPVVIPSRLTTGLAERLQQSRLQAILVVHTNHPQEVSTELAAGAAIWADHGITLLNQSVLLRGINDDGNTLTELSEALFAARILPYYLHQLDKVAGASHFAISDARARELEVELRTRLPGFLVPKLVREIAGEPSKTPL
ncbi:EF-P beta-lysylation protein EpmB [Pseudidiomarina sp.]|uniref:EF-P beta-lysylation protein EpmB n=1 Tax=Pseudidiomarina sp. TaxID=2081707 RepID=UPI00299D8AE1|nr:EF-P beta-lysylation protein EpmB [Pseudidiomarina sp.]MDX1706393.1 EF-P beta-lysylation protein EpmB [Pseudidiomarina sp.]